ncbi:MAG: hypothetical protein NC036_01970 [Muribaculaceae bacterium]|nr:hypothetical protein [Muribaculaceae bacterium]
MNLLLERDEFIKDKELKEEFLNKHNSNNKVLQYSDFKNKYLHNSETDNQDKDMIVRLKK